VWFAAAAIATGVLPPYLLGEPWLTWQPAAVIGFDGDQTA